MKLHELSGEFHELQAAVESGDLTAEDIVDTLDGISGEIKVKAENIGFLVENWDSDADALDKKINELQKRKKIISNRKEGLKNYLRENMERTGTSKIECPYFTITLVSGRDNAVIDSVDDLPDDFVAVVTETKPKKAMITEALKSGKDIPGAHLEKTKSSIRIK